MKYRIRSILAEAKNHIFFCMILFAAGAVIGYATPSSFGELLAAIQGLAARLGARGTPAIIVTLFLQNASAAFLAIWLGLIVGVVPVLGAMVNGIILGVVLAVLGGGPAPVLSLLPHGIFELPAVFIAWGLGLWRGMWPFHEERKRVYKERARKAYYVFFTLIVPLLAVAAVIEGLGIALKR